MRIVPGASPVCSATSLMLSSISHRQVEAIVTGTDDATARAHPRASLRTRSHDDDHRSSSPAPPATSAATSRPSCCGAGTTSAASCATRAAPTLPGRRRGRAGRRPAASARLAPALDGVDVAYYLVHSMGGGGDGDFAERDRARRRAPSRGRARAAGVRRDRLPRRPGGRATSEHLRSREEVAEILARAVPEHRPRARRDGHRRRQRVVPDPAPPRRAPAGDGLPALDRHAHPAHRDPRRRRRAGGARRPATDVPSEVQLGGADVLSYREMMHRYAAVAGRRAPLVVRVPVLTPRLSSYWLALVTPVDFGVARPLVQGLSAEMIVRTPAAGRDQRRAAGLRRRRARGPGRRRGVGSSPVPPPPSSPLWSPLLVAAVVGAAQGVRPGAPRVAAHRARRRRHDRDRPRDRRGALRAVRRGRAARRADRRDVVAAVPRAPRAHLLALSHPRDARRSSASTTPRASATSACSSGR